MSTKPTPKVVHDPYDTQNPFAIIGRLPPDDESESGWVLGWKSPRLRQGSAMGWKGWIPVEYGDRFAGPNGELLKPYLPDAPMRMQGPDHVDNYVRRADLILARIQADLFDTRQMKSAMESQQMVADLKQDEGRQVDTVEGVTSLGSGRKKDPRPMTFGDGPNTRTIKPER
jgi:hypothetical protein